MPLHLEEFTREELQGYVENVPAKRDYKLARFMPKDTTYDIEFSYNIISGGYGQMASITGWDAGAPLRDKDVLAKMTGELGKVQHGYRLTEKEILMFKRPREGSNEQAKAIESVYKNTDKLVWGVQDREEWFRAKAIYDGTLTFNENDVVLDIDFQIPAENKIEVAELDIDWLESLQLAVDQFQDANNGESPVIMHMNGATEKKILASGQIKSHVYGSPTDARIVTGSQLQALFGSLNLPAYEIISDRVMGEDGMESLMPENRIVFIGDDLGEVLYGPTAENDHNPGIYVIPEIQKTNPPKQEVYVGASMFPALKRPSAVVHLDLI